MTAPTIVYDLDGTLADTAGDLMGALNAVLIARRPCAAAGRKRRFDAGGGRPRSARARLCGGGRRTRAVEARSAVRRLSRPLQHAYRGAHRLFPGVLDALDAFSDAGWRQAICTNKMEGSAILLMEKLGVADRFAFICGQDTFGVGKPDPKPLIETIAASGGARSRAIMVGNSLTDIRTARAAGLPVIAVDFGYTDVPVAELGPDLVISRFDELAAACAALMSAWDEPQSLARST